VSFYWARGIEIGARTAHATRGLAAGVVFLAMLFAAFALWTIIPLGWVWIASKASHTQFPSIGPYMVCVLGILATVLADAWLIGRLNDVYVRVTGTNRLQPMRPAWMKSMRDAAPVRGSVSVVEAVMISSVILAGITLVGWFFLLAGNPLPNQ
jgi:hypothetical protein